MTMVTFEDTTLEKAVLGALVSGKPDEHGAVVANVLGPMLDADDFGAVGHRRICEAAKAAQASGAVGTIAVIASLRNLNTLNVAGGEDYVNDLPFYGIGMGDPAPLVERLKELARARRITDAADKVLRMASSGANAGAFLRLAQERLESALLSSHVIAEFESASEGLEGVYQACASKEPPRCWKTGLETLDLGLGGGLYAGTLTVIAARPGVGKTSIATQIAYNVAAEHAAPCLMFSLEMPPAQIWQRVMSARAHVPHTTIRRHETDAGQGVAMTHVVERSRAVPLRIHRRRIGERKPTPEQMIAMARAFKQRFGVLAVLVLDYIQIATPPGDGPKHERIQEVTMALKDASIELGCAVIGISQFNRGAANERPDISQLAQSGALESDADQVLMLYRPEQSSNKVICIVGKQRDGATGDVPMRFVEEEVRFEEL